MIKRIPNLFIKELLTKIDIADIISTRLELKQQGRNFRANCPFHNERIPSFTVNIEKQFFYCFGCGIYGNVIDFIMQYDGLSFSDTIDFLSQSLGLQVPEKIEDVKTEKTILHKKLLYHLMEQLTDFYQKSLFLERSKYAINFLIKNRKLNIYSIEKFKIGFAPCGWKNVIKKFGKTENNLHLLKILGLVSCNKETYTYDFFRNRIIFPIRNDFGKIIAFGGRTIKDDFPKYINSSETEIFQKNKQLYGLYEIKKNRRKICAILVVEGYMDVIVLTQFGVNYAVSSLGTSISPYQIESIYRITNCIIYCYDGDSAGRNATWRALENTLPYLNSNRNIRFMILPDGEDPETFIRKIGKDEFEQHVNHAISFPKFFFDHLSKEIDLTDPFGKAKFSKIALSLISKIPDKTLCFFLRQELASRIGVFYDDTKSIIKSVEHCLNKQDRRKTIIFFLIKLLIYSPKLFNLVPTFYGLEKIKLPEMGLFIKLVKFCQMHSKLTTGQLLEYCRVHNFTFQIDMIATWENKNNENTIKIIFIDILIYIYRKILEKHRKLLIQRNQKNQLNISERKKIWFLNQVLSKK